MALTANSSGVVTGKFRIPDNIPAGAKNVVFTGSGGSVGRAQFIGQGLELIEDRQLVTTVNVVRYDPLAETFLVDRPTQITGVELWVTAKGASPIEVQLREVSNGVPTQVVLASCRRHPSDITLNQWQHFRLNQPVFLMPGIETALVVLCGDADAEVAIAELGKWDNASKRWVTSQPYQVGVLLSSSNASTWTPHQDRDLCFRLRGATHENLSHTFQIGQFTANNVTDLMVRGNAVIPSSACSVVYNLTLPNGSVRRAVAEQPIQLDSAITGTIKVSATLTGTRDFSPILLRDVQLVYGTIQSTSDYVGRAILGGTNVTAKIIVEAFLPGTSTLQAFTKGVDKNDTRWTNLTNVTSQNMDEGWVELTFTSENMTEDMIHAKLVLSGSSKYRPRCRNLRMLVI